MAEIYRNAYITLAAAASEGHDCGFSQKSASKSSSPSSFKLNDGVTEYEIYLRRCLPYPDEIWPAGKKMPVMDRGWVFQERLLSRRFLCFAANEVLWEYLEDVGCSCSTTTECPKLHSASTKPAFLNCQPTKFEFTRLGDLPREELWSLWRELVTQYELSFLHDKLPALGGLARVFKTSNACEYSHGMWIECMEKDLVWQKHGHSNDECRSRNLPSWSRTSAVDGAIKVC